MHTFTVLLLAFVTFKAWSVSVFNCEVVADKKNSISKVSLVKKLLLSKDFTNQISFESTILDLRVSPSNELEGYVNGQRNFIITGTTTDGAFESSEYKGRISCSNEMQTPNVFQFTPWKQFFSTEKELSEGHLLTKIDLMKIKYGFICFFGNAELAAKQANKSLGITGTVISSEEISFTFETTECVNGWGNSQDDWTCEEYRTSTITKSMYSCFTEGQSR